MRRSRLTIAGSMGLVGFAAVCFYALKYPSRLLGNLAFSAALAALVLGLVALAIVGARSRPFWKGFSIVGWAYLIASLGMGPDSEMCSGLVTTGLLDLAYDRIVANPESVVMFPRKWKQWTDQASDFPFARGKESSMHSIFSPWAFLQVGHSALTAVFATLGGFLGLALARRRETAEVPPGQPSTRGADHP